MGTVALKVRQPAGDRVQLVVADDGAGIDARALRDKALAQGLLGPGEAGDLTPEAAAGLAFTPDLSTSAIVTELSGRGIGLAIVRERVESLGGCVELASAPGRGTSITLTLPVSLATFRGVCVVAAGQEFVLPTPFVERVHRLAPEQVLQAEGRSGAEVDGRVLALVDLARVLGLPVVPPREGEVWRAVQVRFGDQRLLFRVDAVKGEHEGLAKGLGRQLKRVRNVSGVTSLGGGRLLPVLHVPDLIASATRAAAPAPDTDEATEAREAATVLVAEDSITSRMLLKSVFEGAGYRVLTAVDGADAFAILGTTPVDALVSDVEMPRMDGFELTERVRRDERLARLPVVLVTALGSREHRERGIDVGANACIVKQRFDQSDLLAAIRRLL